MYCALTREMEELATVDQRGFICFVLLSFIDFSYSVTTISGDVQLILPKCMNHVEILYFVQGLHVWGVIFLKLGLGEVWDKWTRALEEVSDKIAILLG